MKSNSWKNCTELNLHELPEQVRPWLLDSGSLTARLMAASDGDFQVKVVQQDWRVPYLNEARLLGLKPRQRALIREVQLLCHGKPWVYARSVMPFDSLNGRLRFLRKLKNSALGALLFKDPHLKRSHFQVCQFDLPVGNIPCERRCSVFGRRSLFQLYNKPLLVAEVFLPDCQL